MAVPLARAGARVTVVDMSADALATLRRRADEADVGTRVEAVQGDLESLGTLVPPGRFDVALAHGVLHAVDEPLLVLTAVVDAVRVGGAVSVLAANRAGAVLAHAVAGDIDAALAELNAMPDDGGGASSLEKLCERAGLIVEQIHGIGVFGELIAGPALDGYPARLAALARLEDLAGGRMPFRDVAQRIHLWCRRAEAAN